MPTANMTDALVKSLKCDAGKTVIEMRDAALPGLELRVWASGAKTWRLHYTRRSDGKRRVTGLGSYPALALKEARRKAKGLQAEIENELERADPAAGGLSSSAVQLAEQLQASADGPRDARQAGRRVHHPEIVERALERATMHATFAGVSAAP